MIPTPNTMSADALRTLLNANVYVMGTMHEDGSNIRIQNGLLHFGTASIPFFTNTDALQATHEDTQSYLTMPTRTLFESLPNAVFVLNPRSVDKQYFSTDLVKDLLSGSYFESAPAPKTSEGVSGRLRSLLSLRKKNI